jgi:hypothetical protein
MVAAQGTILDRIDFNLEQTNVFLASAHEELVKVHYPIYAGKCFTRHSKSAYFHRCFADHRYDHVYISFFQIITKIAEIKFIGRCLVRMTDFQKKVLPSESI